VKGIKAGGGAREWGKEKKNVKSRQIQGAYIIIVKMVGGRDQKKTPRIRLIE